jgi:hypothetical protein
VKLKLCKCLIESKEVDKVLDTNKTVQVSVLTLLNLNLVTQEATILLQAMQYMVRICPEVDILGCILLSINVATLYEEFAFKGKI